MDEIKALVDAVAGLPNAALWVVAAYLTYRLSILISIYGTVRFLATKLVEIHALKRKPQDFAIGGRMVNEKVALSFLAQANRLSDSTYIHESDVVDLSQAIDTMLATRAAERKRRTGQ